MLSLSNYCFIDFIGLSGIIPSELGNLSELESLYLRGDDLNDHGRFTGTIPPELGNLLKLKDLFLGMFKNIKRKLNNIFQISSPFLTDALTFFFNLFEGYNNLSGSIPSKLGSLLNLEYLDLCKFQ